MCTTFSQVDHVIVINLTSSKCRCLLLIYVININTFGKWRSFHGIYYWHTLYTKSHAGTRDISELLQTDEIER